MQERGKIIPVNGFQLNQDDRLQLVTLLSKAGYSVRIGKERPAGKETGAYTYFVEYWNGSGGFGNE